MTSNRKISTFLLVSLGFLLLVSTAFACYWFFLRSSEEANIWHTEPKNAYLHAEQKSQAVLLAFVDKACGGDEKENPICPAADSLPILKELTLLEVIRNSDVFVEFQYDDRFERELDILPKFYLMNSSGEIRDLRDSFPDNTTLQRWSKIR